jgi:hypothetical protein
MRQSADWPVRLVGSFRVECDHVAINSALDRIGLAAADAPPARTATDFRARLVAVSFPMSASESDVDWWLAFLGEQTEISDVERVPADNA